MKIYVQDVLELRPLCRHLELEGNRLVPFEEAEYVIGQAPTRSHKPGMFGGEKFARSALVELGCFDLSEHDPDFVVTRWWDRHSGWLTQTWLGIPLVGLMDGGLSVQTVSGCSGTYLGSDSPLRGLFEKEPVELVLRELGHSGFVSFQASAVDGKVGCMETGVPGWGLYNILEGVPGTLEEFLQSSESTRLMESWTVSLALTRYPWPSSLRGKNCTIGNLSLDLEKHFWLGEHSRFKNSVFTESTFIGVATGWDRTLRSASDRAVTTCRNVHVEEAQYRTDAGYLAGQTYGKIKSLGLLGL